MIFYYVRSEKDRRVTFAPIQIVKIISYVMPVQ